ncbi:PREDICTED: uncharacterized protein LOC105966977 [Erythranthe guttata]|uniref:uncharacterized protein LOC105966977 n=1 Tax=Erythranthe guttata TaxID=4155 RepID=UPI00064DB32B|nr:PREDICTED: uncharacterized protein LOC105966977 [Erythranthe guttata]|eukprot:XP_012846999.1 PREDICTED: uncharacterized protein LOC105966977 [Erythranthe guttata]
MNLSNEDRDSEHSEDDTTTFEVDHTDYFTTTQLFDSKDEVVVWVRFVARGLFVKIVKRSSPKKKIFLTCDLFGEKRECPSTNPEARPRRTGSKKIGCGFYIVGELRWDDKWEVRVIYGKHNHVPIYKSGHGMSALSQEEAKIISDLSQSHVPPKKILANLRQNGLGLDAYSKQIYNQKAKLKRLSRGDRTVMQHLIGLLEEHNYYKWFRTDETTHAVTDLMWAHPQSVELLSKFPYVLLLDSTYKTNQYKLPLLEIVGVTPVGKNFTVAVAFLRHENEDHYTWVLQKLKRLFPPQTLPSAIVTDRELGLIKALENVFPTVPHLLCLWHINMNVGRRASRCLGNSRRRGTAFVVGVWQTLVKSVSEEDFARNYTALTDEYANYPDLIEYLQYTWLVYKEKFVKAWTDLIFHLGNTSTSRVESNHRALKRWLESSTGGFDTFWAQYHSMMKDQFNEILADFAKSKRIRAQTINVPVFKILSSGIVTHNALQMLDDEKDEDIDGCVCYMRKCLGLPCRHEIRAKMNARRGVFYAEDVHIFWRTFISGFGDSLDESVGSVPDHRSQAIGRLEGLMNDLRERSEIEITDVTDVIFERMHPGAMEMNAPQVLDCPRGRPRTNSTQRDWSGHEFPLFPGEGEESGRGRGRGRGRSRGNRGRGSSSERSSRGRALTFDPLLSTNNNFPSKYARTRYAEGKVELSPYFTSKSSNRGPPPYHQCSISAGSTPKALAPSWIASALSIQTLGRVPLTRKPMMKCTSCRVIVISPNGM